MGYKDVMKKLDGIFGRSLIGTQLNHPKSDRAYWTAEMIYRHLNSYMKSLPYGDDAFAYFSFESTRYGVPLREEVREFFDEHKDLSMPAELLEIALYHYKNNSIKQFPDADSKADKCAIFQSDNAVNIIGFGVKPQDIRMIDNDLIKRRGSRKVNLYDNLAPGRYNIDGVVVDVSQNNNVLIRTQDVSYYEFPTFDRKAKNVSDVQRDRFLIDVITQSMEALEELRHAQIGSIPSIVKRRYALLNSMSEAELINIFATVINYYMKDLDVDELFLKDVQVESVTQTAVSVLSNADSLGLLDSFSGVLLDGKIDIAADKGYPSREDAVQQDAVASAAINDDIFVNVVADGVGGSVAGQKASRVVSLELCDWFVKLPVDVFEDIEVFKKMVSDKMNELDRMFAGSGSQTTVVASFTIGEVTVIANIGDSTAYSYDYSSDELTELTTSDSLAPELSYEEFRRFPRNNVVTAAIGTGKGVNPHFNVINNAGQKIILSSDGVTDLVSERNFKNFFRNDASASYIVDRALSSPDIVGRKSEDNISAIVVVLPNKENVIRRGR